MIESSGINGDGKVPAFGVRHLQCFLLFCAVFVAFATRVNIAVAIVAMADKNAANITTDGDSTAHQQYNWNEKTKSYVLSSFFWGYFITQIPGGYFSQKYGAKLLLLQGILVTAVLTLLTPAALKFGNWQLFCLIRLVEGLSQGVIYPSLHTVLAKWSPVQERNTLGTFAYIGSKFGTVFMLAISGSLSSSTFGWPSIFYVSGGLGLVWSIAWFIWGASTPSSCKRISAAEKYYIEASICQTTTLDESGADLKTPWLKIFTSIPFWALIFVNCAYNWGFWTLLSQTPTYMKYILGMDLNSNGLLSALPYVAFIVMGFVFCWLDSLLLRPQSCSRQAIRKMFTTISLWVPAAALMVLGYVNANQVHLVVLILIIAMGSNAAYFVGWNMNHIDLSPNYAGILMGIANCAGNIMSLIAPLTVGFIVKDETNTEEWRLVFFIAGAFYFFCNLIFLIFGSMKVQPWNEITTKRAQIKFVSVATAPKDGVR